MKKTNKPNRMLVTRRPYCCPVCQGRGQVLRGFYSQLGGESVTTSSLATETCRSCSGLGVIWG